MQWFSAMEERGAGHYGSTEEGCPSPSGEVTEGGLSSLGLSVNCLHTQANPESSSSFKHEWYPNQ